MVELVALTGGALGALFGVYRYWTKDASARQPRPTEVKSRALHSTPVGTPAQAQPTSTVTSPARDKFDLVPRIAELNEELHRGFNASSLSLGLASTGLLFFPPLRYASVPVLIYMGTPSARHAYDLLHEKGQSSRALVETAILAVCLGGGWYWVGSLGFWLYYLGRLAHHNRTLAQKLHASAWALPPSARLYNSGEAVLVPTETLQLGDEVFVETSDVVPVDGVISDGVAWVQPVGATDIASHCLKRVGDRVMAADVVIAGRLTLRVQKAI